MANVIKAVFLNLKRNVPAVPLIFSGFFTDEFSTVSFIGTLAALFWVRIIDLKRAR